MLELIGKLKNKYSQMTAPTKASIWYTFCNVMLKGLALLSTPVFTRILTKEQYGQYALFQSWYSIISIFATLNLFQSVYSKGLITYEKDEKKFTSALLSLSTTLTLTLGVICFVFIDAVENLLGLSRVLIGLMFIAVIVYAP
jgi:O-antigen/teichoic acid export membrane protein